MNVLSDGALLAIILVTALVAWAASRIWTMRGVRKAARQVAHTSAGQSEAIEDENRELRARVEKQESRIRSLETIATDPGERTAREIASLRHC